YELSPGAGAIYADALRVRTKVTPPGQAIPAMPTRDMAFADNKIVAREPFHMIADKIDNSHKFVADGHGYRNRFLRPRVPVIDVHIGPADGGLQDPDEHIVSAHLRNRNFLKPQARLGSAFYDGLHHFLHAKKLGELGAQETKIVGWPPRLLPTTTGAPRLHTPFSRRSHSSNTISLEKNGGRA